MLFIEAHILKHAPNCFSKVGIALAVLDTQHWNINLQPTFGHVSHVLYMQN
jgi:hypothetical protein